MPWPSTGRPPAMPGLAPSLRRRRGTDASTLSSTRRCVQPRSSSTSPAPSRAPALSSPTRCPRSPPPSCARRSPVPREHSAAFAPGRVNLIGEHTDYNDGLALPFAIAEVVTVSAEAAPAGSPGAGRISAYALDLGEHDEFAIACPGRVPGWRAFVRGVVAELAAAGCPLVGARLEISAALERGAGLSSSAALEVALCLALAEVGGRAAGGGAMARMPRVEIARLCARVENDWVGAHTGLLDQLASLYGAPDTALCIDFRSLEVDPVPLVLGDWRLVVLDSGEPHLHASSGYNERRAECA